MNRLTDIEISRWLEQIVLNGKVANYIAVTKELYAIGAIDKEEYEQHLNHACETFRF